MMSRFFSLFLLAVTGWLAHGVAWAQAPVEAPPITADVPLITASLSARVLGPQQQAVLSYQITGATRDLEVFPQTIEVAGLTIALSVQPRIGLSIDGTQREISIRYMVQSGAPGEYEIPPQTFRVDGRELQGPAVKVTVREGERANDEMLPNVQLTLGKTEFWKGEIVPVQVSVIAPLGVQPLSQFFPQVKTPNFAVNRFDRSVGQTAREVNGEVWRAWQMESVLSALQAGAQEFGPAEIKAELMMPLPGGNNDPFGRQQGVRRNVTLTSNAVPVNVKELPMEGKPANFSGAVGEFEIELQATPVSLKAGDPIALEIAVTGTGNFDAVTAPRIENADGWRLYEPRVSQENRAWGTELGRKNFTQILIPEKTQTRIPPFVLEFFDPQSGTYVTRKSSPVALTVIGEFKPASNPGADSKDFAAPVDASAPSEELGDILDQPLTGSPWMAVAAAPMPVNPWLLHGGPALLLGLLLGSGLVRRWRASWAARRPLPGAPREPYQILGDLRQGGPDRRSFYGLVNEYLAAAQYHLGKSPAAGEPLAAVLLARDRWLYGPDDEAGRYPVPSGERQRTLDVLSQL